MRWHTSLERFNIIVMRCKRSNKLAMRSEPNSILLYIIFDLHDQDKHKRRQEELRYELNWIDVYIQYENINFSSTPHLLSTLQNDAKVLLSSAWRTWNKSTD